MAVAKPTLAVKGDSLELVIDGHIEGTIAHHSKHLVVGTQGRIKGQVHASSITVLGQVIGEIRSDGNVSLAKGANVQGNIFCARIIIEDGARLTGRVHGEIRSGGIVSMAKGACVQGDIFCARVLIEDGARFNGQIDTGEPPGKKVPSDPAQGESVSSGKTRTVAA